MIKHAYTTFTLKHFSRHTEIIIFVDWTPVALHARDLVHSAERYLSYLNLQCDAYQQKL
jgi:hypothetical protein